ncbi:MAG TPA: diacylglycerol kinase family protein [Polyangiaceae bacterium]|jgi:diacylglycerol kinase (ATP)|nr:diacylglycerol kinase family protein [Polyangiaceae bacterium]
MRTLVIVNPRSGGGRGAAGLGQARALLERRLGSVELQCTERPGHAIDIAREATADGRALIVAVGGDGTLHEVANGILDAGGGATLGYVGLGTGGDFRRTLGIPHRLDAYVEAIATGADLRVDVGKLRFRAPDGSPSSRWFVNVASAGMGGLVDRYVAGMSRSLGGRAAYFLASAKALAACERGRLRCGVTLGDEVHERRVETFMFAVCNGRYFGSGMHVAPSAKPDDGRFEVVSMDAPSKLAFVAYSRRIYDGSHLSTPGVQHFGCDHLALELENEAARDVFLLDVDGEPLGGLPLDVELVPRALTVRVPTSPATGVA